MILGSDLSLVIVNRLAGGGRSGRVLPNVVRAFADHRASFVVHIADGYDQVMHAAMDVAGFARIIVVGGDGTINATVNGLVQSGTDVPVGIVPAGTGNEFIRAVGIPKDSREAIRLLFRGVQRRIDVGVVNGTAFVNSFGIGLDACIAQAVRGSRRRRWLAGRSVYYLAGARALLVAPRPELVEVRVNGQRFCQEALMLSVVNARPYLARGLADGVLEDGQFNLYLVEPMARWRVLKSVISRKGWFAQRDVLRLKAARMTVTLTRPAHGQTDGSLLPPTPFYDLQVLPSRISLIVPPTARPVADRVITTSSRGFMAETMRVSA